MQMIGHDDIASDKPGFGDAPGLGQSGMRVTIGENPLTMFGDHRDENDNRRVERFTHRLMRRMFSTIAFQHFLEGRPLCRPKINGMN